MHVRRMFPLMLAALCAAALPVAAQKPVGVEEWKDLPPSQEIATGERGAFSPQEALIFEDALWCIANVGHVRRLFRSTGDGWQRVELTCPTDEDAGIDRVVPGPDNSLLVYWYCGASVCSAVQIRGGKGRVFFAPGGHWNVQMDQGSLFVWKDGAGRACVSVFTPLVGLLREESWTELAAVPPKSSLHELLQQAAMSDAAPVDTWVDPLDRIWMVPKNHWGDEPPLRMLDPHFGPDRAPQPQDTDWGRAFQIVDAAGGLLAAGTASAPERDQRIRRIAVYDHPKEGMRWGVLNGRQIWEVDIRTLAGTLAAEAGPEGPAEILNIVPGNGDSVWIVSSDGFWRWKDKAFSLVKGPCSGSAPGNLAVVPNGTWMAAAGDLWFVPDDGGAPRVADEQSGYTLGDAVRLHTLPDKTGVMALRMNDGMQRLPDPATLPEDSLLASPEEGSIGQIPPDPATRRPGCAWAVFSQGPIRTKSGVLYGITWDRPGSLARWDGRAWTWRSLKEDFGVSGTPLMDMVGNLWLMEGLDGKGEVRLARFVPEEERFDTDSVEGWVGRLGKCWLIFGGYASGERRFMPLANTDGRVLQMTPSEIRLYDKEGRHSWPAAELMKTARTHAGRGEEPIPGEFPDTVFTFFNEENEAVFVVGDTTLLILRDGAWKTPQMPDSQSLTSGIARLPLDSFKDESATALPEMVDGLEMTRGRVWRTVGEERRDIFEGIPLPSLVRWEDARLQAVTCAGGYPCFMPGNAVLVVLEQAQPQPVITPEVVAGNRVALVTENQPPDTTLYWRVSGDWKPCAGARNETAPLPNGAHTIQCRFVDAALNTGPVIEVKAEVRAGRAEVEGWAEALVGGTPEEKDAARASLNAVGAEVFPLLVELAASATPEKALHFRWAALRLNADFVTLPNRRPPDALPEPGDGDPAKADWSLTPLQRDAHGYVWSLLKDKDSKPQGWIWTGGRWLHVFTLTEQHSHQHGIAFDSRDQVWIAWDQRRGHVMVGEPLENNRLGEMAWKEYTSMEQALDARFDDKTVFAPEPARPQPRRNVNRADWGFNRVLRLPGGGLAFHDSERVAVRLEGKWRVWGLKQIIDLEPESFPQLTVWGVGASGLLEVGTETKCVRLEPGAEPAWKEVSAPASVDAVACASVETIGGVPEGVPALAGEPPAERVFRRIPCPDGVTWDYGRSGLFREGYGLRRMIAPLEALPDPGENGLEDIQTSPCGTVFFSSLRKRVVEWNLRAASGLDLHPQAPETRAELTAAGDGMLSLRFTTGAGKGKVYHTWRVDGGPWQCATDAAETVVGPLSPGPRRVEVRAVSEWVVSDPSPLLLETEVVLAENTVDQWLKDLVGKDIIARDRATRALLALGADALPKLEALRETVQDNDTRWWVDTLIERIRGRQTE